MVSARRDHFLLVVIPAYCANWLTSAPDGTDPTGKSESSPLTARYAHFCKTKSNFHKVLFRHQKSCASLMATNAKASLQLSWMRRRRNAGCQFVRRLFQIRVHAALNLSKGSVVRQCTSTVLRGTVRDLKFSPGILLLSRVGNPH